MTVPSCPCPECADRFLEDQAELAELRDAWTASLTIAA